jgi:hypothetical protein
MIDFLLYSIPWYWQAAIILVVFGVPIYLIAVAIWGHEVANKTIIGIIITAAAIGGASRLRQQGYKDRIDQEQKAQERAEEIVDDKRDEIERLPDDELDKRLDKWTKP